MSMTPEEAIQRVAAYRETRDAWQRRSADPEFISWLMEQAARLDERTATRTD